MTTNHEAVGRNIHIALARWRRSHHQTEWLGNAKLLALGKHRLHLGTSAAQVGARKISGGEQCHLVASIFAVHHAHGCGFAFSVCHRAAKCGFAKEGFLALVEGEVNPVAHMVHTMVNRAIGNTGADWRAHHRFATACETAGAEKVAIHAQEILCARTRFAARHSRNGFTAGILVLPHHGRESNVGVGEVSNGIAHIHLSASVATHQ